VPEVKENLHDVEAVTEFGVFLHCVQTDWNILFLHSFSLRDSREICLFQGVATMTADYNRVIEELNILHVRQCVLEFLRICNTKHICIYLYLHIRNHKTDIYTIHVVYIPGIYIYIPHLEEHCHNSKNTTFQQREKTTGQGDAVTSNEQRHFYPLAAILEYRRVTLFHYLDMVSGIPPVSINQNVRFLICDTVLAVRYVFRIDAITFYRIIRLTQTANIARVSNKLSSS
jgi:hypothetical protein